MRRVGRAGRPDLVVIDPVAACPGYSMSERLGHAPRQITTFKSGDHGVMTGYVGRQEHGAPSVPLVDTWLLPITMQNSGERNRGLYVLKSRGMRTRTRSASSCSAARG